MEAIEKANSLIEKFYQQAPEIFGSGRAYQFGIDCSIIMVAEILELDDFSVEGRQYWNAIMDELKKLK